ncbi:MAG: hypothetical protein K6F00_11225 [Lachnospiraceae bacterium]|nr:hypothetical protein [Lachnospiraceae bacterium]
MDKMILCKNCIAYLKSRGEKLWVGPEVERELDWNEEGHLNPIDGLVCEWCEEEDDELYECHF